MNCCIGQFPWSYGCFGGFSGFNMMNRYASPFNMFFNRGFYGFGFACNYPGNWAAMVGQAAGQRTVVRICYESLLENLNNLTFSLSSMSSNNKMTQDEEKKLEEFKKKAQELLNNATNYGKSSQNALFSSATDKIFKYEKEYYNLRDAVKKFQKELDAKAIKKPDKPDKPETPDKPDKPVEEVTPPADDEKIKQIKEKYNKELRPQLNKMLNDRDITKEDKKALKEKSDEFVKAAKDNKSAEELQKIYDELETLATDVASRISKAKTEREAQELKKAIDTSTKRINEVKRYIRENQKYTNKSDREALLEKINELNETIKENASTDEILKKDKNLETEYNALKQHTSELIKQSDDICSKILEASNGVDWSFPWSGDTENETAIKEAVKKINKTNVKIVLNRWNEVFKDSSGDTSLLETLYGEFKSDSDSKKEMTNTIAKAIDNFAKENNCSDKIGAYLKILQGNSSDNDKYRALDSILSILNSV